MSKNIKYSQVKNINSKLGECLSNSYFKQLHSKWIKLHMAKVLIFINIFIKVKPISLFSKKGQLHRIFQNRIFSIKQESTEKISMNKLFFNETWEKFSIILIIWVILLAEIKMKWNIPSYIIQQFWWNLVSHCEVRLQHNL